MKIKFRKKFLKELAKLPNPYQTNIEEFVFDVLPSHNSLNEVGKIEKMTGYKNCFKVRFGNYRVGIKKVDNTIVIETVKHRKKIYQFFP
jgi:mRNA interferase RelE/StbE